MTVEEKLGLVEAPLTPPQLAKVTGVSRKTVIVWINKFGLPANRVGKNYKIEPDRFLDWWSARQVNK